MIIAVGYHKCQNPLFCAVKNYPYLKRGLAFAPSFWEVAFLFGRIVFFFSWGLSENSMILDLGRDLENQHVISGRGSGPWSD